MYYLLNPELKEIEPAQIDPEQLTVGYIERDELEDALARFDFSDVTAADCLNERDNYRNAIEVYEGYTFGLISIVDVKNVYATNDRLAFFLKRNLLLVVSLRDEDSSTRDAFLNAIRRYKPNSRTLEKTAFALLESTIRADGVELDAVRRHLTTLEDIIAGEKADKKLNAGLYTLKKKLLILRSYYEQIIDIGETLAENENELFEAESLHYFDLLTQKAERLCGTVAALCDELNQLRDMLQFSLDYRLNVTMKALSIITTVCLPLTLIVGWYGMNFNNMLLINSSYGYPLVACACVALVTTVLLIFKKKGLL